MNVREIERLFDDFGPIERVDMKSGPKTSAHLFPQALISLICLHLQQKC